MENRALKTQAQLLLGTTKLVTILVLLTFTISSCGLFKKTSKQVDKERVEVAIRKDSVEVVSEQATVSERDVKKDINTMITETETTTRKTTSGSSSKIQVPSQDLSLGTEQIFLDNNGREIAVLLDSISKVLTITVSAPEQIEETIVKVTKTEHVDRSQERQKDSTTNLNKQVAYTTEEKTKVNNTSTSKESSPSMTSMAFIFFGGLLALFLIYNFIIKRFIP